MTIVHQESHFKRLQKIANKQLNINNWERISYMCIIIIKLLVHVNAILILVDTTGQRMAL